MLFKTFPTVCQGKTESLAVGTNKGVPASFPGGFRYANLKTSPKAEPQT